MRKRGKQLVSLILAGALAGSLAGCMPTQSKETAAAPAKTQDTKVAETQPEQTRRQPGQTQRRQLLLTWR